MSRMNEDAEESPFSVTRDAGTIQVTYCHIPFEIKTLYSQPHGVWTAYVTSEAISNPIFPKPPTYETREEAFAVTLQATVVVIDTALNQCDLLMQQLGNGQPVDLQGAGGIGDMVRTMAESLLASDEIDQTSDIMRRFRQAFEQSM